MAITLRATKGSALTHAEMDGNFTELQTLVSKATPSITDYGVTGDGQTDDTAAIQSALNAMAGTNTYLYCPPGTYIISSRISIPTKTGLIGNGDALFYATAAGFSNTDPITRYTSTSSVFDLSGQTSSPYTANDNQKIKGIRIQYEFTEGRCVDGIVARNCNNVEISGNELFDFPCSKGIVVASLGENSRICDNYIHDFSSDTDWGGSVTSAHVNITGIDVDDDRVNDIQSLGILIQGNVIENLGHGTTGVATYGDQADGIGLQKGPDHKVIGNTVNNVNEGIDLYCDRCTIIGNRFYDCGGFAIKLVHGASFNTVSNNIVVNPGLAGVTVTGGNLAGGNTEYNIITDNIINEVDPTGVNDATTATACIKLDNQSAGPISTNNTFERNYCNPGTYGNYAVLIQQPNDNIGNRFVANRVFAGTDGTYSLTSSVSYVKSAIPTLVRAYRSSTTQTITTATWTKVELDAETVDRNGEFDSSTNYRWTCVTPGYYRVIGTARIASSADVILTIRKNNSAVSTVEAINTSSDQSLTVSDVITCAVGDYIELFIYHATGADRTVTNGSNYTYMTVEEA